MYYSTDVNFIASQALARTQQQPDGQQNMDVDNDTTNSDDAMAALERQARAPIGFVAASNGPEGGNMQPSSSAIATNPDALDVDLDEE